MTRNIRDLRERLSRCRQFSGLKSILDAHTTMLSNSLYSDRVKLNAEDLNELGKVLDQAAGLTKALKGTEEALEQEQARRSTVQEGIVGLVGVLLRPSERRKRRATYRASLASTEKLQARLRELKSKLQELEASAIRRFFHDVPLAIQVPKQPNVFGIDNAGFEEGRREFRFFGRRAKYMVLVKLNDYLPFLNPAEVLAVLKEELDAYSQHLLQHLQNDLDASSLQAHAAYRSMHEQLVADEETHAISYGACPEQYNRFLRIRRDYTEVVESNYDLFHTHMNRFLRRILPLPQGFREDILICLDDRIQSHSRQKGLFALLESYFEDKGIVFDVGVEDALGVGEYMSVRIGDVVQQTHREDVFLGLPIEYYLVEARIWGGCVFMARSYYDSAHNVIFLEDLTGPSRKVFADASSTSYSAEEMKNDILDHEKAHVVYERMAATCAHMSGHTKHVLSEVFARLVDGCLGTCTSTHIKNMIQMEHGDMFYAAAFRELNRLLDLRSLVCKSSLDHNQPSSQIADAPEYHHLQRLFRDALLQFCTTLVTDYNADPEIISTVRMHIMRDFA